MGRRVICWPRAGSCYQVKRKQERPEPRFLWNTAPSLAPSLLSPTITLPPGRHP
ncbi:hypothetical protein J6590_066249, partial [Homalodisca vitripennis]